MAAQEIGNRIDKDFQVVHNNTCFEIKAKCVHYVANSSSMIFMFSFFYTTVLVLKASACAQLFHFSSCPGYEKVLALFSYVLYL